MGLLDFRHDRCDRQGREGPRDRGNATQPGVEGLETRHLLASGSVSTGTAPPPPGSALPQNLTTQDVQVLLQRAARATASDDGIVAVVDRNGVPLGIRVEGNVSPAITGNTEKLVFSIDGALAEARTGAFFASNAAPLTSRTVNNLSQSTMTQREIQSDPNIPDPNSTDRGPGFVAPVGKKGHFPPRIMFTPQVDLFQIEHTNRDSIVSPGPDHIRGTADDITLGSRFNADPRFIPPGKNLPPPESYGFLSGLLPAAQSRGIGTLPGGLPIYKNGQLVGGIGVFFPGTTGFATEENSDLNDAGFYDPTKRDRALEAEYVAFVALGGSKGAGIPLSTPAIDAKLGLPAFPDGERFNLPFGRIDLVGITLDIVGAGMAAKAPGPLRTSAGRSDWATRIVGPMSRSIARAHSSRTARPCPMAGSSSRTTPPTGQSRPPTSPP